MRLGFGHHSCITSSDGAAASIFNSYRDIPFQAFESFFLQLVAKSGNSISTRTATQIATQLACGLFSPFYGHMDPMHVGEAGRALLIAQKYGQLLQKKASNLNPKSLIELTTEYPSHGFVIDRLEAERLFKRVREPNATEEALIENLGPALIDPFDFDRRIVAYLSSEVPRAQALPGLGEQTDEHIHKGSSTANESVTERRKEVAEDEPRATEPDRAGDRAGEPEAPSGHLREAPRRQRSSA